MSVKTTAQTLYTTHEQPDVAIARYYRPLGFLDFSQPLYPAGSPGRLVAKSNALKQIKDGE
jgi:hypothetical protein